MDNMQVKTNPLMDFARKVECSVKLPSQGIWYDEDVIEFNQIGEVDVKPMLPNDEMAMANPETLISGESILKIITSCCEGVKKPEELYYPDVNALLLAIRKATYGDTIEQEYICPQCWSKKTDIENAEYLRLTKEKYSGKELTEEDGKEIKEEANKITRPIIAQMEKEGKLLITPQKIIVNIDNMLNSMTLMPENSIHETAEGLKIYLTPYKCSDKIKFTTKQLKIQKLSQYFEKESEKYKEEDIVKKEYLDSLEKVTDMYFNITDISLDILAASILKIVLPDGNVVDNKDQILEYIKNIPVSLVGELTQKVDRLNEYGVKQYLNCKCECCGHTWDEKFFGFNQTDFFGIGS